MSTSDKLQIVMDNLLRHFVYRVKTNLDSDIERSSVQELYGHGDDVMPIKDWLVLQYQRRSYLPDRLDCMIPMFKKLPFGASVMEIGSASGDALSYIVNRTSRNDLRLIFSDPSRPLMDRFLPQTLIFFGIKATHDTCYCPAERLDFAPNSVHFMIGKSTLHHWEQHKNAIESIARVLKPGGSIVFFNDPIRSVFRKSNLLRIIENKKERSLGYNCREYSIFWYFYWGRKYFKTNLMQDPSIRGTLKFLFESTGKRRFKVAELLCSLPLIWIVINIRLGLPIIIVKSKRKLEK